jgi:ribosomal protein S12 methylthiotransferase accessory factor
LRPELGVWNAEALRDSRPWLLVKPLGRQVWIGPLFHPGKTGCWQCLAERMRANFPVVGYLDSLRNGAGVPATGPFHDPAARSVAWGLAAHAIASWVAQGGVAPRLEGKIQTFDLPGWHMQSHELVRRASCPACGSAAALAAPQAQPLRLQSQKKTYCADGGHRVATPEETLSMYGRHVSRICGAATMLERSAGAGDGVLHVYLSGLNIACGPSHLNDLKSDLRSASCGKGTTDAQARASALCEALERYSGCFQGDEPRRRARYVDLGDAAIHPNTCMLFSDKQLQRGDNGRHSFTNRMPRPFDPERPIEWSPVWSLTRQATRFLPTSFCYFSHPDERAHGSCVGCSNGNAAGNTLEEAILQGFLELVERDSVALWWYNRVQVPGIDLESFNEPYLARLRAHLKTQQRDLWALDLTTDLNIPSVAAVSSRTDGGCEQIMFGFGAHLDPRIALLRAVTELNQMLAHLLTAPADDATQQLGDKVTRDWLKAARLADQCHLVPQSAPLRTAAGYPRIWTDDLAEDIRICQARVEERGMEMLVLNQTRAEVGLPVVKVIVPGLRHFWPRFAPGRLYDVPVQLGWLKAPLLEDQLNPIAMFL